MENKTDKTKVYTNKNKAIAQVREDLSEFVLEVMVDELYNQIMVELDDEVKQ